MRKLASSIVALSSVLVASSTALDAAAAPPAKDWEVELLAYGWIPSLDAELDVAGAGSRHVSTTLLDTLNAFSLGAMGRVSGRYHRFVGLIDGMWSKLEDGDHFGNLGRFGRSSIQADIETQSAFVQALGGYRVYEREGGLFGGATREKLFGVDLLTGLTYTWLAQDVKLDFDRDGLFRQIQETRHFSGSRDWVAPFVGARLVNDFTPRLRVETYGGAGGFGAGNAPDISWQLTTLISYRITDHILLTAGHRLVDLKFDRGDDDLDVTFHGPIVGVSYRF